MATNISTINHTGEDYSTFSLWESATDIDLVSAGDIEVLEIYSDDGPIDSSGFDIAGATTDASNYRIVRAADGHGWAGDMTASSVATINATGAGAVWLGESYVLFEGIVFTASGDYLSLNCTSANCTIARCFFDGRDQTFDAVKMSVNSLITRCIAIECDEAFVSDGGSGTISNSTCYKCAYGFGVYNHTALSMNNISLACTEADFLNWGSWSGSSAGNIGSGSNTYDFPGGRDNRTATASTSPGAGDWVIFANITSGSEDLTLYEHAENDAVGYGTTQTGEAILDASELLPRVSWDSGALTVPRIDNVSSTNHSGEDYSTITLWEADTDNTLTTSGKREILEIYDDFGDIELDSSLTYAGAITNASYYRKITVKSGDGWRGDMTETSAAKIVVQDNDLFYLDEDYFVIDGLRFAADSGASNQMAITCRGDNDSVLRCFFDGRDDTGALSGVEFYGSTGGLVARCVFIETAETSIDFLTSGTEGTASNNFITEGNYGLSSWSSANAICFNNITLDCTDDHFGSGFDASSANNITSSTDGPNGLKSATLTDNASPGEGTYVIVVETASGSEDFRLQDVGDNDAVDYGTTLTGEAVTDAQGYDASGTWECGAFNFAPEGEGEIYEVTLSSSLSLSHLTELQRWRDRITSDSFFLNDGFILEIFHYIVINEVFISSNLLINDGINIQRWRDRIPASAITLGSDVGVQRSRDRIVDSLLALDSSVKVSRELSRFILTSLEFYDDLTRTIQTGAYAVTERILSSSLELDDKVLPIVWYVRRLFSSFVITHSLTYEKAQFLLHAITLHSELEVNDVIHVERRVLRLVESFVPIYEQLLQDHNRQRKLTDNFIVYDDILQDAIKVLSDILLHDNLELSDNTIISLQRLFKPLGIIIYGLDKAGIQYGLKHSGKIEYTLQGEKKIIYTLENIKGSTVYH